VQFSGYYKFVVHGLLIARGTANEPITFTCAGRSHGAVAPPCWYGIIIMGKEAGAYLRNCRFEGMYQCLVWESSPVFDSCEFAGNHYALYCTKKASPHLKNCRFYRNVYGVVADFGMPVLVDNVITGRSPLPVPTPFSATKPTSDRKPLSKAIPRGFRFRGCGN
jgi:hypothetical protein